MGFTVEDSEVEREGGQHECGERRINPDIRFHCVPSVLTKRRTKTKSEPLRTICRVVVSPMKKITRPTEGFHPVLTIGCLETLAVSPRLLPTVSIKVSRR